MSNLDRILNDALTADSNELHHSLGMSMGSISGDSRSRSSMATHMAAILGVKSRFVALSGVRFHATATNATYLIVDEKELRRITHLPRPSSHAQKIADIVDKPSWEVTKVEAK